MWTGNSNIPMAARELTAADCAFAETRQFTAPSMAPYFTWIKDCVAVDTYTFQVMILPLITGNGNSSCYTAAASHSPSLRNLPILTGNGGSANWRNRWEPGHLC